MQKNKHVSKVWNFGNLQTIQNKLSHGQTENYERIYQDLFKFGISGHCVFKYSKRM